MSARERKMQAITYEIGGLECDAEGCDYEDTEAKFEEYDKYLNQPCPKCGANLLTEADLKSTRLMVGAANLLNEFLGEQPDGQEVLNVAIDMDLHFPGLHA
jgi:hypothetical protein